MLAALTGCPFKRPSSSVRFCLTTAEKVKNDYDEIQKTIEEIEHKSDLLVTSIPDMSKDYLTEPEAEGRKVKSEFSDPKSPRNHQYLSEFVKVSPKKGLMLDDARNDQLKLDTKQPQHPGKHEPAAIAAFANGNMSQGMVVGSSGSNSNLARDYKYLVHKQMQELEDCLQKELSAVSRFRRDQSTAYLELLQQTDRQLGALMLKPI